MWYVQTLALLNGRITFCLNNIYSEMRDEHEKCCCRNATVNYLLCCYLTCATVSNIKLICHMYVA